jgi:site-specific recombinase XerD
VARRRDVKQRGVFERPKGSGVFWIRYFVHGRERREKVGGKQEAIDRYRERKTQARDGTLPQRGGDRLLSDFVAEFLDGEKHRMRSFRDYARQGAVWSERFRGRTLRSILPLDIQRWASRRAQEVSAATVNRELSLLRRVFNVAIANDLVERNPVKKVRFYRENNARVRFLTNDEETRLRTAIGEELWPLVAFALHTGLRQAEQFGLRWVDIDFANRVLTIPRSKHGDARHVHLSDTALAILQATPSRLKSPYVFPSATGETARDARNFYHRVFQPALRRARIDNFRWHDLRHTFASRLVMRGADLRSVQELMGHKTITMTLRYSHLSTAHRLAVVRLLDEAGADQTGTKPAPDASDAASNNSLPAAEVLNVTGEVENGPRRSRTCDPLIKSCTPLPHTDSDPSLSRRKTRGSR